MARTKITVATQRRTKKALQRREMQDMRTVIKAAKALLLAVRPQGTSHQSLRCPACDAKEIWGKSLSEKSFRHRENCTYIRLRSELVNLTAGKGQV